jgi:hypothetical protein
MLLVDIAAMPQDLQTEVVKALTTSFEPSAWQTVRASEGKGPWSVVGDKLKIPGSGFVYPRSFLEKEVLLANRIEDPTAIPDGTKLLVPPIPASVEIDWEKSRTGAEVLDYKNGVWHSYFADATRFAALAEAPRPASNFQGAIWAYKNVPHGLLDAVLKKLRPELREAARFAIEHFPGDQEFAAIELLDTPPPQPGMAAPPRIAERLDDPIIATIRANPAGSYEIWDVFSKPAGTACSHGEQVRKSAAAVLEQMGVGFLAGNILTRDIDYRRDTAAKKQLILSYLSPYTQDIRDTQSRSLDRLADFPYPADGALRVPLLLLQAMAGLATRSNGSVLVVSQSFVVLSDTYAVLPNYYNRALPLSLIAAAKNAGAGDIEASIYVQNEPLSTYRNRRGEGLLVVGGVNELGAPYGMTSAEGVGVTVPGLSTGWAVRTGCTDDTGNSFAAPQIGAMLLAARIYWRNEGITVSAAGARIRLMLSAEARPGLVGKYAAPGLPDPRRLMLRAGVYGVLQDGSVERIPVAAGDPTRSRLLVFHEGGAQPKLLLISASSFALQRAGDQFLFLDAETSDPSWKAVELRELKIAKQDGTTLEGDDAFTRYQAIIGVENED